MHNKPIRYLPPGTVEQLFEYYNHQADPTLRASRESFRLALAKWKTCLKFRAPSQHAKCSECTKLGKLRQEASSVTEQKKVQEALEGPAPCNAIGMQSAVTCPCFDSGLSWCACVLC